MRAPEEQARIDAIRDAVITRLRAKWAKLEAQKKARAAALHQKTKNKPKRRAQLRASSSRYQKRHPDKVAKRDRRARNGRDSATAAAASTATPNKKSPPSAATPQSPPLTSTAAPSAS
jgi:hypothetical protein